MDKLIGVVFFGVFLLAGIGLIGLAGNKAFNSAMHMKDGIAAESASYKSLLHRPNFADEQTLHPDRLV